jgi:hypothetical protein
MHEHELKLIEALQDLPILAPDDPWAVAVTDRAAACQVAEADDLVRLHELLYRDEYRPVVAVRCGCGPDRIRVYFELRDRT